MIRFLDGPAEGVTLRLRRAPLVLRAVRSPAGEWDALDQLGDRPRPSETIVVYVRASAVTQYHLLVRGKNRQAGGWYLDAKYRLLGEQPSDAEARDVALWRAWCTERSAWLRSIHEQFLAETE